MKLCMKTVGELKEFIKDLPNDMLLANYRRDMETSGYRNSMFCEVDNMERETRHTYDAFDYTPYSYEVMVSSKDGIPCLKIH